MIIMMSIVTNQSVHSKTFRSDPEIQSKADKYGRCNKKWNKLFPTDAHILALTSLLLSKENYLFDSNCCTRKHQNDKSNGNNNDNNTDGNKND